MRLDMASGLRDTARDMADDDLDRYVVVRIADDFGIDLM
jgi:hypothetical protein